MRVDMAEARGKATIRPWRVGVLIDTGSRTEVREAIANLSSVWGGRSMPIFDKDTPVQRLEALGEMYDVDSLYADTTDGELDEFLRKPGWAWRGRGTWGPFGALEEEGFRMGLLPLAEVLLLSSEVVQPLWSMEDPNDLVLAALWGLADKIGVRHTSLPLPEFLSQKNLEASRRGVLGESMVHTDAANHTHHRGIGDGVFILRPDVTNDVVSFWNARAFGSNVIGVPADAEPDLVEFLLSQPLPSQTWTNAGGAQEQQVLNIVGACNASDRVMKTIRGIACANGMAVQDGTGDPEILESFVFEGLNTDFTKSLRVDFRPEAHGVDIDLPRLPLVGSSARSLRRGIVAVEVHLSEARGQDPRFTSQIPPYRRHAALLEAHHYAHGVEHVRPRYGAVVFGLDANSEAVRFPFVYSQDALRLLFDSATAKVIQSDVGKFQTRAAERFGGPYSGTFNQSGVRAAVALAAGKAAGVSLPQLRQAVEKNRGSWPHPLMDRETTPREYANRAVNNLFHSGLFVPTLRVHCSHCRVESYASVEVLGPSMNCEFCGQTYNLALSHSLTRPDWRYRLAAHLRADQIEALLPALATTSLLRQLQHDQGSPPLVLGFQITIDGRTIEADVATYLGDLEWLAVLGEVKTANRIDEKDIANLEFLASRLRDKRVRCLPLFATLKSELSPEERNGLRGLVERSELITMSRGQSGPSLPLVLTGSDLSRNWWDDDHPWRWEKRNHNGIFDTALISCERNLGLLRHRYNDDPAGPQFLFEWAD
ncbi:hypothetical protein ACLKOZ_03700 [Arthrobacter sp. R4]|uniref:hypothetical protein n=1 Tax=Arthrobacter sp. R4 TaxID=644417 RepID=UPI003ED9B1F5